MSHLHRFYHVEAAPIGGEVALSRDEAHHAMRVLRARPGDAVELFNGRGHAWRGTIASLSRNDVLVAVEEARFIPQPAPSLTLAQAWLHRDKLLDELVRSAAVLGVARIRFFRADHSEKKPKIAEKWERLMVEACKQCGRLWLPQLEVSPSLGKVLDEAKGEQVVLATMEGPHQPLTAVSTALPITYVVGPEGDFSPEELARAREAGAIPISLGAYTFRSEMAATTGLTLLQFHLGQLG